MHKQLLWLLLSVFFLINSAYADPQSAEEILEKWQAQQETELNWIYSHPEVWLDTNIRDRVNKRMNQPFNHPIVLTSGNKTKNVFVMIHGLSASGYSFYELGKKLCALGYNVVIPRLPGHGMSVELLANGPFTNADLWKETINESYLLAQQLGDNVVGVGYSLGGLLLILNILERAATQAPQWSDAIAFAPAVAIKYPMTATLARALIFANDWLHFRSYVDSNPLRWDEPTGLGDLTAKGVSQVVKLIAEFNDRMSTVPRSAQLPNLKVVLTPGDAIIANNAAIRRLQNRLIWPEFSVVMYPEVEKILHERMTTTAGFAGNTNRFAKAELLYNIFSKYGLTAESTHETPANACRLEL